MLTVTQTDVQNRLWQIILMILLNDHINPINDYLEKILKT